MVRKWISKHKEQVQQQTSNLVTSIKRKSCRDANSCTQSAKRGRKRGIEIARKEASCHLPAAFSKNWLWLYSYLSGSLHDTSAWIVTLLDEGGFHVFLTLLESSCLHSSGQICMCSNQRRPGQQCSLCCSATLVSANMSTSTKTSATCWHSRAITDTISVLYSGVLW